MGLDTSHGCWHGAYSIFAHWRNALAEAAGYGTKDSTSIPGEKVAALDWDSYEWCNYQGLWQESPSDVLITLLVHSDCDGYLFPERHTALADRLTELLPKLSDEPYGGARSQTNAFIAGLHDAADKWEVVVFH